MVHGEHHSEQSLDSGVVCPKCLCNNLPTAAFCSECGAPIGMVSTIDPIQQIQAEGFAYRSAVDSPPKLIIVIGMWAIFFPGVLLPIFVVPALPIPLIQLLFYTALFFISIIVIYRVTKNYITKTRESRNT